ncbi:hypothetical protein DFS33DRAFT_1347702 [Desarmillaria ectypa]|nr:hypothetical protein DFS33DRAFT_1347702 [Desarmillaria ectypa]
MSIDAVPSISNTGSSKTRSQSRKGGSAKPQVSSTARAPMVPAAPSIPSPRSTSDQPSDLMVPPLLSVTGPTPEPSPIAEPRTPPPSSEKGKGKRKADEVEGGGTPPEAKKNNKTTFAAENPRPHRTSGNSTVSHAPSSYQSYHRNKRVRLSGVMSAVGEDRYTYQTYNPNPSGSFASRGSSGRQGHPRSQSRPSSFRPKPSSIAGSHQAPSRRSISQASIPISALISPHAPSISQRSTIYHMRDPRKPPRVQPTPWTLAFPVPGEGDVGYFQRWKWWQKENKAHSVGWADGGGSPLHAWLFFLGFVLFPIWWVASLLVRIPKTRRIGDADTLEKGVVLDDPQVEHDAKSWRKRCRIMAAVSLVTYVPFIVLVAVFAR